MEYWGKCQSEAVFGSSSRRDSDELSDKDYLIIDSRPEVRRRRRCELEQLGWSVASYSWTRFAGLARQKALFVQHLKLEALIMRDDASRLMHALSGYSPKSDYNVEVNQSARVLLSVINEDLGLGSSNWKFDVLAVNIRNLAILALANRGEYVFSYGDAMERLAIVYGLPVDDARRLLRLREIKARYRHGCFYSALTEREVDELLSSVQRCVEYLGCSFVDNISTDDFLAHSGVKDLYFRSRLIERDVLGSVPVKESYREECEFFSAQIMRKVRMPRDYLWRFEHDLETVQEVACLRKISQPLNLLFGFGQSADCNVSSHIQERPCLLV